MRRSGAMLSLPRRRPRCIARELLQDATKRSGGLSESAKHVNVTCAEDTTMNGDKQCLQPDVTEADVSRRVAGRTCSMIVMFIMSYDMGQWLELKRVMCQTLRTQRAVKLEALLVARTQCQTEYIGMITTRNECQLPGYMLQGKLAICGLLRGSVVPAKFLLCRVTRCLVSCVTKRTIGTEHCTD